MADFRAQAEEASLSVAFGAVENVAWSHRSVSWQVLMNHLDSLDEVQLAHEFEAADAISPLPVKSEA